MRSPGWVRATAAVLSLLAPAGCGVQGLNFREDTRVRITAPADRTQVGLPVTIEWEVSDFHITGPGERPAHGRDAGYFAVLIDRAPQPPGQPLSWHARDDDSCSTARGCPDEEWYAQRQIFTTTDTTFTVAHMATRGDERRDFHEAVIILLDTDGRRIGESAFAVEFELRAARVS